MEEQTPYEHDIPMPMPRPSTVQDYVMHLLGTYRRLFAECFMKNLKIDGMIYDHILKLEQQQENLAIQVFNAKWDAIVKNDYHEVQTITGPVFLSKEQFKHIHDEYHERFAKDCYYNTPYGKIPITIDTFRAFEEAGGPMVEMNTNE